MALLLSIPASVSAQVSALSLAKLFQETNLPVVDADGKLVGTILEREILRRTVTSFEA